MYRKSKRSEFRSTTLMKACMAAITFSFLLIGSSVAIFGQTSQLTLADILIGLRSKKATLPERNKILSDAVKSRGITFSMGDAIEKELSTTGADQSLIDSIRKMNPMVKTSESSQGGPAAGSADTGSLDFQYYENRGSSLLVNGSVNDALADFNKAIELNASAITALLGRGKIYFDRKSYTVAIADYSKVLEAEPNNAVAFARRGKTQDVLGNLELASADLKKAVELDPANAAVKADLVRVEGEQTRIQNEKAAAAAKLKPEPPVVVPTKVAVPRPEFVDLGQVSDADAVRMAKPAYTPLAANANLTGKVVVEIELDAEGNVTSADAKSGPQLLRYNCETAARKSKFKPAMFDGTPIKAKATIVYSFVGRN